MSTSNQLYVQVVKKTEKEFVLHCISIDKEVWYILPEESRDLSLHTSLSSKKPIYSATAVIKKVSGYRTVGVKIDENIKADYFDEEGNVCYKGFPLEEYVLSSSSQAIDRLTQLELEDRIKRLELQLKSNTQDELKLHHIEKKFILEKFEKKQHEPTEWFHKFEDECNRFQITSDSLRIQALCFFITGSARDWYETNLTKIGLNSSWALWKNSFHNVFVDKGWSMVRKAFSYKYLGGSLIDYALAKEKLCLEVEPKGTELSFINHIVFGLPTEAQNELDREEITTLENLYTELRKLEDTFKKKDKDKLVIPKLVQKRIPHPNKKHEPEQKNDGLRKACSNCDALGFPGRYHPVSECRNKRSAHEKTRPKMTEHSTNLNDIEILNVDFDDKNLN